MSDLSIYTVGGTVQAGNGGYYISRDADTELLALCRKSQFSYVLTARQMGKSSLMEHTSYQLAKEGVRTVIIDLTSIGSKVSIDEWYTGVLAVIEEELDLDTDLFEWWKSNRQLSHVQRFSTFLEKIVLAEVKKPIIIFIDEVDSTLSLRFDSADFFAAIRQLHNRRAQNQELKRLSFVLIGVATPSELIDDPKRTPFNIGTRVDIEYFTLQEAMPLSTGFGLPNEEAENVLRWVLSWTGGHPFLTQHLCNNIATEISEKPWTEELVRQRVKAIFLDKKNDEEHLRFVSDMLTKRSEDKVAVLKLYEQIRRRDRVEDKTNSPKVAHLKLAGVVQGHGGFLHVSNRIYEYVFDPHWLKQQLTAGIKQIVWYRRIPVGASISVILAGIFAVIFIITQSLARAEADELARRLRTANKELERERDSTALYSQRLVELIETEKHLNGQLFQEKDSTATLNEQLSITNDTLKVLFQRSDSLNQQLKISNGQLFDEKVVSDSLKLAAQRESETARNLRFQNMTLILADDALRQASLGNKKLGALLARQAYAFYQINKNQFLNVVYQAMRETLNELSSDEERLGGPYLIDRHNEWVRAVTFSPDGKWIASASDDGKVHLNPALPEGESIGLTLEDARKSIRSLAFHPSGDILAAGYHDGTVVFWHDLVAQNPKRERISLQLQDFVSQTAERLVPITHTSPQPNPKSRTTKVILFSPTGTRFIHSEGGFIKVYDNEAVKPVSLLALPQGVRVNTIAANEADSLLLVGGSNGKLYFFKNYKPTLYIAEESVSGSINSVVFRPNTLQFATGGEDTIIRLWTFIEGNPVIAREFHGHEGPVNTLTFDRTGMLLISGSSDGTIQLWDARDNITDPKPVVLNDHQSWVWSVATNPRQGAVVSSGADKSVRLWMTDLDAMADEICRRVPDRVLSRAEWNTYVGPDFSYEEYHEPPCAQGKQEASP